MSVGRKEAFEVFKRDYPHNGAVEEHKRNLKQRLEKYVFYLFIVSFYWFCLAVSKRNLMHM
jgi:hypothetical protein